MKPILKWCRTLTSNSLPSGHQTHRLPRTPSRNGKQRPERPSYRFNTRSSLRNSSLAPAFALAVWPRDLYECMSLVHFIMIETRQIDTALSSINYFEPFSFDKLTKLRNSSSLTSLTLIMSLQYNLPHSLSS